MGSSWINSHEIDRAVEDMLQGRRSSRSLGNVISDAIRNSQPRQSRSIFGGPAPSEPRERPGEGQIFEQTNDQMIRKLVDLVWIEDQTKVAHLGPLLSSHDQAVLVVATLNYDNAFELAGQAAGVTVETGIGAITDTGRFPTIEKGVYLLKLHGSIDWSLQDISPSPEKPLASQAIQKVSTEVMRTSGYRPALIFGQRNKLTAKGPFLDILAVFREQLTKAERLTVIGYSFRDEHVNEYIGQWLNADRIRKLRIINGEKFAPAPGEFAYQLLQLPGRVELIPSIASVGIRDCFSQTKLAIQTEPPVAPSESAFEKTQIPSHDVLKAPVN